ncbi:MAG: ACP S-malonyltransferase [Firmicutes bacterium]|nr:ACP S-malonyltransferase [Bacillota bacterium]
MGRIAFVFSGQGDQFPGMGKELYDNYDAARKVFDTCESLRPGTLKQCFEGTEEELKQTSNTQPCMFAMELAAAAVLTEKGIEPEAAAGFSLGEVAAAAFSGVFSLKAGFELVTRRGQLMQEASETQDTSMAAVVKLTNEQVEEVCAKHPGIYPVNYNSPGQVSVSGLSSEMPAFKEDIKAIRGRVLPLNVRGAFHSPFMQPAAESFAEELKKAELKKPAVTLYANLTARPYGDDAFELLSKQIVNPVRWEQTVRNMIASGIDTFIEIGPGQTLINLIRRTDANVKTYSVSEMDALLSEVENA